MSLHLLTYTDQWIVCIPLFRVQTYEAVTAYGPGADPVLPGKETPPKTLPVCSGIQA